MHYAKRILLSVGLTLVLAIFANAQPGNGIYRQAPEGKSGQSIAVMSQDGTSCFLGAKESFGIRKVHLYSQNNQNSAFYLSLTLPFEKDIESSRFLLIMDGTAYRSTGGGSSGNTESSIGFVIADSENAERVGAYFSTSIEFRKNPNHNFLVTFAPVKTAFDKGEDVFVKLSIVNIGTESAAFMKGGRNRGSRDNQYVFSAQKDGIQVDDIGSSLSFGGLALKIILKPGEVFEDTVSLSKWFAFTDHGTYKINGSYYLDFNDPKATGWKTIWEENVSGDFIVRIQ